VHSAQAGAGAVLQQAGCPIWQNPWWYKVSYRRFRNSGGKRSQQAALAAENPAGSGIAWSPTGGVVQRSRKILNGAETW